MICVRAAAALEAALRRVVTPHTITNHDGC